MKLKFSASSDIGNRPPPNQDRYCTTTANNCYLLAVCDGMGGHQGGEVAAEIAIQQINGFVPHRQNQAASLRDLLFSINEEIMRYGETHHNYDHMGTTLTLALVGDSGCWCAHIGDSRLYRYRQKHLELLTIDHRFLQELIEAGDLTETDARSHPLKSQLDQALGMEEIVPDIFSFETLPGDLLLLCTDGISDMLYAHEIQEMCERHTNEDILSEKLVAEALKAGGLDNCTALTGRILQSNKQYG